MGFTPRRFWESTTPPTTAQLNAQRALDATATLELEGAQAPQSKTIASGSISPTASYVIVDTEGRAAADDLSVISPVLSASENLHDGMIIHLKSADSGRVVTVKNSSRANGINTYDGNDYALSPTHWLKLQLRSGKWYEIEGRAMVAALAATISAAAAAAAAGGLAGRVDAAELKNTQQDTRLANVETKNTQQDTRLTNAETALAGKAGVDLNNVDQKKVNVMLQQQRYQTKSAASGSTTVPFDGTIPQNTEGDQYMSLAFTPKSATSKLVIDVVFCFGTAGNGRAAVSLYKNSDTNAMATIGQYAGGNGIANSAFLRHVFDSPGISAMTFKVRAGNDQGLALYFNGASNYAALYGGCESSITISEYAV